MGKHFKQKQKNNTITNFILIGFLILLIISLVNIVKWYVNNKENEKIKEEISSAITIEETDQMEEENSKYNVDFKKLKKINEDTVGWLKVNGTNIEYAVVKSDDKDYYLNHNFDKKYNSAGWIFADYRNKIDGTDKNTVIYGHNRRDGSMFGTLKNILKEDWLLNKENRKVTFITENQNSIYEVFSVYEIEVEDYYITTDFKNTDFLEYIEIIKKRSIQDFDIEIKEEDSILTLSTCADNNKYRVVLHARKVE